MIQSLYSIAVFVTDIDRARRFYGQALKLTCTREGSFGSEYQQGDTRLGVHPAVHPDARALVGRHTGVTFHVKDLLEFCEHLHSHGVRFLNEPTQQSFGIMAMVSDPDDNIFALWEDKLPEQPA